MRGDSMERTTLSGVETVFLNKESLTDISELNIDTSLDKDARILHYVNCVKDPYQFRVGDTPVSVCYSGQGTLQESITKILSSKNTGKTDRHML